MPIAALEHPIRLFWDIDGTLLLTHGAAARPFAKAVSEYAGKVIEIDRKNLVVIQIMKMCRFCSIQ
jgi:hypothetical protein